MKHQITNQKSLRAAFWETTAEGKRGARNSVGEYPVDTRVAFVDFVDNCARSGLISESLASRATLEGR